MKCILIILRTIHMMSRPKTLRKVKLDPQIMLILKKTKPKTKMSIPPMLITRKEVNLKTFSKEIRKRLMLIFYLNQITPALSYLLMSPKNPRNKKMNSWINYPYPQLKANQWRIRSSRTRESHLRRKSKERYNRSS